MADLRETIRKIYGSSPAYSQTRAGLPENYEQIRTIRDLLDINYKMVPAREQIRQNLIAAMRSGQKKYPGIIGYDDDVVPALDRAILSGHDIFLVGQIGQAKTRLAETIAKHLLSPIPVIEGSITNDSPMDLPADDLALLLEGQEPDSSSPKFHISPESAEKILDNKFDTKVKWVEGAQRFRYVLATPDISVKDLVGYIDAIKVAKKGVEMYKIDSYSPGQLMQAKHGIFCIDELPVLDPRKQVALLSVLQEGRYTTGSYPVIFEPKTMFFATANPIDYTHSGKIIEPLYDRLKSHIHTHYPKTIDDETLIMLQEAKTPQCVIPSFVLKTLARLVQKARTSPEINQTKGVSVRFGIHGLELLVGESERTRAIPKQSAAVLRHSDMYCLSQIAKFELSEIDDTLENRLRVFRQILDDSIRETCLEYLHGLDASALDAIKQEFSGKTFQASQKTVWKDGEASYESQLGGFARLAELVESRVKQVADVQKELESKMSESGVLNKNILLTDSAAGELRAAVLEMILDGLCFTSPKVLERKEGTYVAV